MSNENDMVVIDRDGLINCSDLRRILVSYWRLSEAERKRLRRFIELYPECPEKYKEALDSNYTNP